MTPKIEPSGEGIDFVGTYGTSLAMVRRQSFWNQCGPKLIESLAYLFGLFMRRAGGDASVAPRMSSVCTILPAVLGHSPKKQNPRHCCRG